MMNMKRLGWLVTVVLVSVVAWASPALAGPAKVYVADEEGDTVTVLDATSFARLATIPVGREPHNVQVSPDGRFAFVTNTYANTVSVIEVAGPKVIATVPVGKGPNGISVTP
jgi:YVTN family beta-propeller protein